MTTYKIPEENLDWLEEKIEKLSAKAAKLGCDSIGMTVLDSEMVETHDENGYKVAYRVFTVEVTGEAPKMNGWVFVGKLEHMPNGNVIKAYEDVPEIYRNAEPNCDHCHTKRDRLNTYIVRKGNDYKQVGSSCVADFTGHSDPQQIAQICEWICDIAAAASEKSYDPDRHYTSPYTNLETYLSFVALQSRTNGYVSKTKARETQRESTASMAITNMLNAGKYSFEYPSPKDVETAKTAIAWIRAYPQENLNDYMHNLILICSEDYIGYRHFGFAASLIATYRRAMEQETKRNESPSNWVGETKKRQDFENLTVVFVKEIDGFYGVTYMHKFQDENGNILVWFATNGTEFEIGDKVSGKATVKKHDEYNGQKQTTINRCKFELVEA